MSDAPRLTHVDETGAARMVDVSAKDVTARQAVASGRVLVSPDVVTLLRGEGVPKGDALGVARVAGIMAAKRTPDLVPLCHPLAISGVTVDLAVRDRWGIPVARLSGATHPETVRTAAFMAERAREWLLASGAQRLWGGQPRLGLSGGQH